MIKEAIILAGGKGTRLQSVVHEIPKPMAPIGSRPFLSIIIKNLSEQGIKDIILSVGYKYQVIQDYFGDSYHGINIKYAIENEPLGTGGAVSLALSKLAGDSFLMLNGDTLFDVDLAKLSQFHKLHNADLSIALKPIINQDRYGSVDISKLGKIKGFTEKKHIEEGLINGGIYASSKTFIESLGLPNKYSWETDLLEPYADISNMYGYITDSYFIDIGIPEDYARAQLEL